MTLKSVPSTPLVARIFVRLAVLLVVAFALGACSKCDVPDFTHWGSRPPPHACD